jgi:ATP-binding protein involved in chromosome partitioning
VDLQLGYPAAGAIDSMTVRVRQALEADPAIESAAVSITSRIHVHKVQGTLGPLPNVKNIIVVASGKGGVGKSTVSANLALALQAEGAKVGVLDADIYGPSQPTMLGVHGKPASPDGKSIIPMQAHGMPVMSIGFLVEADTPMIWRGPMVTQAMMQLLTDTRWEQLDYLIVDLPPGTGDIQLTLSQKVHCGHEEHIFGEGGGERMSTQYGVPYLGSLPLDIRIREQADSGNPTVVAMPDSELAARYREIARNTAGRLSRQPRNKSLGLGKIVVQGAPAA